MLIVNPRGSPKPNEHALFWGVSRRYYVPSFPGPLSIKSVVSGSASWTTDDARHVLGEASYLVVNHLHPYTLEIESRQPVETFCVFFAKGFVDSALRDRTLGDLALLDHPGDSPPAAFREALLTRYGAVGVALADLRAMIGSRETRTVEQAEDALVELASALVSEQAQAQRVHTRIPSTKRATRDEIFRRLGVARDFIEASLGEPLPLRDLARAAHLSPFHLHRHFRRAFGETPHAYRTRRLLDRAASTLRAGATPVSDVALDAGFSSLGSFSSLFKRRFGVSPRQFRSQKEQD